MPPIEVSPYSLALPLFAAKRQSEGVYQSGGVVGTGFILGNGFILTAAHVAHAMAADGGIGVVGVPIPGADEVRVGEVAEIEILKHDLAILHTPLKPEAKPETLVRFPWSRTQARQLDIVWSVGFAYGTHIVRGQTRLLQRVFSGSIVSVPGEYEIPSLPEPFAAYELSFAVPRGLSGAPLLVQARTGEPTAVLGVVIGNSSSSMVVQRSEEKLAEPGHVRTVETVESLTLGIAVHSSSILPQHSKFLRMSIGKYLDQQGLLGGAQLTGSP